MIHRFILLSLLSLSVVFITSSSSAWANEEVTSIQARIDSLGLQWRAGKTSLMAMSEDERSLYFMNPSHPQPSAPYWGGYSMRARDIERSILDWRDFGGDYVSGVRDQSSCGACWDFAATACMESAFLLAAYQGGVLGEIDLSEQRILSCLDDYMGYEDGCHGGHTSIASWFAQSWGMVEENCFPYMADDTVPCDEQCPDVESKTLYFSDWGWVCTEEPNVSAIIDALNFYGPLAAWMDAPPDFAAYSEGIYQASEPGRGGHYVLIVGYNTEEEYWIGKNSWGEDWGMDGFFYIAWDSGCDFGRWTSHIAFDPTGVGPIARFELEPQEIMLGDSVSFQDSSIAVNAPIVTWEWDFDRDGIVDSYEASPTNYVYSSYGSFEPFLRVIDSQGYSHETIRYVTVLPEITEVAGSVSGNWTPDRTYIVTSDLEIANGSILTIEPGCQILFDGYYAFHNYGHFQAIGTLESPIRFSSTSDRGQPGDWSGIAFHGSTASGVLDHCDIEYAMYGVIFDATGASSIEVRHCTIANQERHGLYSFSGSAPLIENNDIFSNGSQGIECVSSPGPNVPIIRQNRIHDNRYHGLYLSTASPHVIDNDIYGNRSRGITCKAGSTPSISGNLVHDNAYVGILSENAMPNIVDNAVYDNGTLGVWIGDGSDCQLLNNTIVGNGSSGVYSEYSTVSFINNIIVSNGYFGIHFVGGESIVQFNDVWGNAVNQYHGATLPTGVGVVITVNANGDPCDEYYNVSIDPMFGLLRELDCAAYCLQEGSPCIDAGNPDPEYLDPDGSIADIGAYYFGYTPVFIEGFGLELTDEVCRVSWEANVPGDYRVEGTCGSSTWVIQYSESSEGFYFAEDIVTNQYRGHIVTYSLWGVFDGIDWMLLESQTVTWPELLPTTKIRQAYPNPFNPSLMVAFSLSESSPCRITVMDVSGREVICLKDEILPQGEYQLVWAGNDSRGRAVSSGVYFIQLEAKGYRESTKVVLLR